MKPSLQKLQKFLKLEAERGYDNRAVVGGLGNMLSGWEAEARADGIGEELISAIAARLRDYATLTPLSRSDMLQGVWRRLQRESGVTLPPLPSAANDRSERGEENAGPQAQPRPEQRANRPPRNDSAPRPERSDAHPRPDRSSRQDRPPRPEPAARSDRPERSSNQGRPDHSQRGAADNNQKESAERPIYTRPNPPAAQLLGIHRPENRKPLEDDEEMHERASTDEDEGEMSLIEKLRPPMIPAQPVIPHPAPTARPSRPLRPMPVPEGTPAALSAPVTVLSGVGPRLGQTFANLGIQTLGDMLYYFPRRYLDYSQLLPINRLWYGQEVTVLGMVQNIGVRAARGKNMQLVEAVITDGSGSMRVTWFNQPWLARRLHTGAYISISGKVEQYLGRLTMSNPEMEMLDQENLHTNRIVPIYGLTASITQRWLRNLMHQVVVYWAGRINDHLLPAIREQAGLMDLTTALLQIHFPDSADKLAKARHRLAFDEIFLLQLGVLSQKRTWIDRSARIFATEPEWLEARYSHLPFSLTGAQQRAIEDIRGDLASGHPMNRLLQGDVGSGKTIVAALAIAMLARSGAQSALMAPTSILAEQHYRNLQGVLCGGDEPLLQPAEIGLLIGATPENEKETIRQGLANGQIKLVIGTHALLEDPVNFSDLELTIIDEQHRFGVQQRATLRSKGQNPHLLVMTATPIPRSLALTVYGDLDLTVLDEMPPGRQPVETQVFYPRERERAYSMIRSQLEQGHQAFIIYPLVEESEKSEAMAAVEEHARLQKIFPKHQLGLLHGRLKSEEKEAAMTAFRDRQTQVLVSTSVVEVGVDIPNATVMLVEGANRFGLSQLHQFRGRVGRGQDAAYCILIPENPDEVENTRLSAMAETNDGFVLAERDLEQRGPGSFLGTRQSGYQSELRLASLTDIQLIEKARRVAQQIFAADPDLSQPQHQALAAAMQRAWNPGQGDVS